VSLFKISNFGSLCRLILTHKNIYLLPVAVRIAKDKAPLSISYLLWTPTICRQSSRNTKEIIGSDAKRLGGY